MKELFKEKSNKCQFPCEQCKSDNNAKECGTLPRYPMCEHYEEFEIPEDLKPEADDLRVFQRILIIRK
ncbi:uncharacterized protein N7529_000337 [Penicillium soppii]|uniref:uncharacterized protein n=1 Tax=Penicillium soppii TaxID=69789 RepID=UPI002548DA14|nr:uncharacterized protein N7529_000337 [Penicillium soppii]KAJ5881665.1 hypothetical protein N7529_000337 [Penicillium soppii]